jgi:DNA-binding NtrC family response regulator
VSREAILCIDDETIILMSLVSDIKDHFGDGFIYRSSSDPAEVIDIVKDLISDGIDTITIVSDWLMPGKKGDELITEISAFFPNIRCVIITGHGKSSAMDKVRENPFICEIVDKPWRPDHLMKVIERARLDD